MQGLSRKENERKTYDKEADLLQAVTLHLMMLQRKKRIFGFRITDMSHSGYSDIFIIVNGIFVAAELKDNTGKPSAHQLEFIDNIRKAGGVGGVCKSIHDVNLLIAEAEWK